jgi:hypothetical protein
MSDWERSAFALSAAEQEVHEAIMALMRVLQHTAVGESTRFAIQGALNALRAEQSAPGGSRDDSRGVGRSRVCVP